MRIQAGLLNRTASASGVSPSAPASEARVGAGIDQALDDIGLVIYFSTGGYVGGLLGAKLLYLDRQP